MPAPAREASRPCEMHGCHAWAMHGDTYCRSHRDSASGPRDDAETDERLAAFLVRLQSADADALLTPALQHLIDDLGSDHSLQTETGVLRLMLHRLVATGVLEGNPKDTVPLLTRLSDAIGRAMRTQQVIAAGQPNELQEAVDKVLNELGLDGVS